MATFTFNANENPFVGDGGWSSLATGLTRVQTSTTAGGIAFPTDAGGDDDSYATRSPWTGGNDYTISGVVYRNASLLVGDVNTHEVELHVHVTDSASGPTLYEADFSHFGGDSALALVRWDNYNAGGGGSATPLTLTTDNTGFPSPIADGTILQVSVTGSVIAISANAGSGMVQYVHYDFSGDATKYTTGNPGFGVYSGDPPNNNLFGWKSITLPDLALSLISPNILI